MAIKARIIPFVFDWDGFSEDLKNGLDNAGVHRSLLAAVVGIDVSTLANWMNKAYPNDQYPQLGNFLAACNWLDLDPRQYFLLAED